MAMKHHRTNMLTLLLLQLMLCLVCSGFVVTHHRQKHLHGLSLSAAYEVDRRTLLVSGSAAALLVPTTVQADDTDMTQQLFNEDGSLKNADTAIEARFRTISVRLPDDDSEAMIVNGNSKEQNGPIAVQYDLPETWNDQYQNRNNDVVCEKMIVSRPEGFFDSSVLETATKSGVVSALKLERSIHSGADLLRAARNTKTGAYEFDLAVAPKTCDASADNLGLGFCPYDTIYLLSSILHNSRLYIFMSVSTKQQWKIASAELKRARSSFRIVQ